MSSLQFKENSFIGIRYVHSQNIEIKMFALVVDITVRILELLYFVQSKFNTVLTNVSYTVS